MVGKKIAEDLLGLGIIIQSVFTIVEGEGKIVTERKILNDIGDETVTFDEYFTGAFGTTEYQADMTNIILGVDDESIKFSYHGKKLTVKNAEMAYVTIPDVLTTVSMGGDNDVAYVEEGIAFSPVYHLGLQKTVSKGGVKTWLNLQKAN